MSRRKEKKWRRLRKIVSRREEEKRRRGGKVQRGCEKERRRKEETGEERFKRVVSRRE